MDLLKSLECVANYVEHCRPTMCKMDISTNAPIWQMLREAKAEIERLQEKAIKHQQESRTNDGLLFSELASNYVRQLAERCTEVKRLQKELADTRNAVKLIIGRVDNFPWPDVPDVDVDGYVEFIRQQREPSLPETLKADNVADEAHDLAEFKRLQKANEEIREESGCPKENRMSKPKPYFLNDDHNGRLAIRDNGDGRAWLIAENEGCLLTPRRALAVARWLERWATEKETSARKLKRE